MAISQVTVPHKRFLLALVHRRVRVSLPLEINFSLGIQKYHVLIMKDRGAFPTFHRGYRRYILLVEGKEALAVPSALGRATHKITLEGKRKKHLSYPLDGSHSNSTVERGSGSSDWSGHLKYSAEQEQQERGAKREQLSLPAGAGIIVGTKGSVIEPCSHDRSPVVEPRSHNDVEETITRLWTNVRRTDSHSDYRRQTVGRNRAQSPGHVRSEKLDATRSLGSRHRRIEQWKVRTLNE